MKMIFVALFLNILLLTLTATEAVRVNLIDPTFIKAEFVEDNYNFSETRIYNLTLSTRAARYKLLEFDTVNGKAGRFIRDQDWVKPKEIANNKQSRSTRKPGALLSVQYQQNASSVYLNITDNRIIFCSVRLGNVQAICETVEMFKIFRKTEFFVQIEALAVQELNVDLIKSEHTYRLLAFDAAGRIIQADLIVRKNKEFFIRDESIKFHSLNALKEPEDKLEPFPDKGSDLVKNNTQIESKLRSDYEIRSKGYYIEAISPVFYPASTQNDSGRLSLCVANGYINPKRNLNIYCRSDDKDMDIAKLPDDYNRKGDKIIAYSFHIVPIYQNQTYIHLFYDHVNSTSKSVSHWYYFNRLSKPLVPGNSVELWDLGGRFTTPYFDRLVNDIVGYNDGTCSKTIAFYEFNEYSVHEPNERIDSQNKKRLQDSRAFFINAAMAVGKRFYFFTFKNTLLEVEGTLDRCEDLRLDFSTMKESFSEVFIAQHMFGKSLMEPFAVDYREIDEQGVIKPYVNTNGPVPPTPGKRSSSSAMIIIIGLILAGLIIASLMYIFCLRGTTRPSSEEIGLPRKSRKSRRFDKPQQQQQTLANKPASELHAVTVRSAASQVSPTTTTTTTNLTPSTSRKSTSPLGRPKSMLKSPSSKIVRSPSTKSIRTPSQQINTMVKSPSTKSLRSPSQQINTLVKSPSSKIVRSPSSKSIRSPSKQSPK